MPPFPNMWRVELTFDLPFDLLTWISIGIIYSSRTIYLPRLKLLGQSVLELSVAQGVGEWHDLWLWPTDLNINRDHLLIKDYLPTKFEAFEAKHSWVISCTRYGRSTWPLTLSFDLLTWKSIGIFYLYWTIYPPSLKLVGQSIVELSVAQGIEDQHDLWPTDLNINRDHLLIKDYLPTKFEASGAKCYQLHKFKGDRHTDWRTDWPTDMCNRICPPFSKGGIL